MKDVTDLVSVDTGEVDGEHLPIYRCICGTQFESWNAVLGLYPEDPWVCPNCGVRLYFKMDIKVVEV